VSKDQYRPLIASHPVYDYLSYRYTMNIKSVHWEPDQKPATAQWIELKTIIKNHPAKWMVWEGEPVRESVEALRSIGVESIVFDPCGNVSDKGDFLTIMQQNVENLKQIYR
jgi:zinc transport system substrate-binding protein